MTFEYTVYIWPLIISATILSALWLFTFRHRQERTARIFLVLLTALSIWVIGFIFEIMGVELETKILLANLQFLGLTWNAFLFLLLVIAFTGRGKNLKFFLVILGMLTVTTNLLIWTNDLHHWFRQNPWLDTTTGPFLILVNDYGPWFNYVHIPISYISHLLSLIILLRAWRFSAKPFRSQITALILSLFIPLIVDGLYVVGISPIPNFNFAPAAFSISGFLMAWALFYHHLFDLVPLANDLVVANLITGIIVLDLQDRVISMNASAQKYIEIATAAAIGQPVGDILSVWDDLNTDETPIQSAQLSYATINTKHHYDITLSSVRNQRDQLIGKIITISDTTEHFKLFKEIEVLAGTDDLTGVYNRRNFLEIFKNKLNIAQHNQSPLAFMMFDIDDFKLFNDQYGHAAGDKILLAVTIACQACLRENDLIGRYGGDEFIILLPKTEPDAASQIAERIYQAINTLVIDIDQQTISITISLGVVKHTAQTAPTTEQLMSLADQAMYQAKEKGKNRIVEFLI